MTVVRNASHPRSVATAMGPICVAVAPDQSEERACVVGPLQCLRVCVREVIEMIPRYLTIMLSLHLIKAFSRRICHLGHHHYRTAHMITSVVLWHCCIAKVRSSVGYVCVKEQLLVSSFQNGFGDRVIERFMRAQSEAPGPTCGLSIVHAVWWGVVVKIVSAAALMPVFQSRLLPYHVHQSHLHRSHLRL